MRKGWAKVTVGDVARLDVERIPVRAGQTYKIAGVLNAGRGMLERDPIDGSATNYPMLYRLRMYQLVMRKLTAWEGPITVVPRQFHGHFVSTEFPTFTLDRSLLLPDYMRLICQQPEFWKQMRDRSTGTVQRRKRVSPGQLLQITFDLPPINEQRRTVDLIKAIDQCTVTARATASGLQFLGERLRHFHFSRMSGETQRAGDFFEIRMGRQRSPKQASGPHMVKYLRAANVKDGRLDLSDVKLMNFMPSEQEKFALWPGDVLVTEGCGSLSQLGASAQWPGGGDGAVYCFQNTLIRLRGRSGVSSSDYAYQWARHSFEAGAFSAIASGTNIFHLGAERVAVMPVMAAEFDIQAAFVATVSESDTAASAAEAEVQALVTLRAAVLDDVLTGSHEIPDDYDAILEKV